MKNAFVIMTNTICQGDIIACWGDEDQPVLFDTEVEAWKEIADHKVEELTQFIKGERELEETDFSFDEWVVPVTVHKGIITSEEHDVIWDPATSKR